MSPAQSLLWKGNTKTKTSGLVDCDGCFSQISVIQNNKKTYVLINKSLIVLYYLYVKTHHLKQFI